MKRFMVFILSSVFIISFSFSETIYLKDGNVISGKIINQTEEEVILESEHGELVIKKSNIDRIDYNEATKKEPRIIRNSAFLFRPLATAISPIYGGFEFVLDGQTAFSKNLVINAILDIGTIEDIFFTGLNLGPQYNITGDYLNGFYIGMYPGYLYMTDYYDYEYLFTFMFEVGYQKVNEKGFTWGLYTGYLFAGISSFKFGLKIGFAYPDRWIKVEE